VLTAAFLALSCGAKTGLVVQERVPIARVEAYCSETIFAQTLETVELHASLSPDSEEMSAEWSIASSVPAEPSITIIDQTRTSARITSDRARTVVLKYTVRRIVRDPLAPNNEAQCQARVVFLPDLELSCPDSLSGLVGQTIPIPVSARSRRGRPLVSRWRVNIRPTGPGVISTSVPVPLDTPPTSLLLDARGKYELDFVVRNDLGESAACRVSVFSSALLAVTCPPDVRLRALQTAMLSPASLINTTNLSLQFNWELVPPTPRTSTSRLVGAMQRDARLFLDIAGEWVARLRVSTVGGMDTAACSTRVTAFYDDDVRVEVRWNPDSSCRTCGALGEGHDVGLLLTNDSANGGEFLGPYHCYRSACVCPPGGNMLGCDPSLQEWPPQGPENDATPVYSTEYNLPGPEVLSVNRAVASTEFAVGVLLSGVWRQDMADANEPAITFVRIYCRGALQYESENVEIPFVRRGGPAVWRVGRFRYNEDGTCTTYRKCAAGQSQRNCVGLPPTIYEGR
jgi:hypothetical protein